MAAAQASTIGQRSRTIIHAAARERSRASQLLAEEQAQQQVQESRRDGRPERDGEAEDERECSGRLLRVGAGDAGVAPGRTDADGEAVDVVGRLLDAVAGIACDEGQVAEEPRRVRRLVQAAARRRSPSLVSTRPSPAATTAAPPSSSCSSDV